MCHPSRQSEPSLPGGCPPQFKPSYLPTGRHSPPPSHPPVPISPLQWLLTRQQGGFREPLRSGPTYVSSSIPCPAPNRPPPAHHIPFLLKHVVHVYTHAVGYAFLSVWLSQAWHTLLLNLQCSAFLCVIISGFSQLGSGVPYPCFLGSFLYFHYSIFRTIWQSFVKSIPVLCFLCDGQSGEAHEN